MSDHIQQEPQVHHASTTAYQSYAEDNDNKEELKPFPSYHSNNDSAGGVPLTYSRSHSDSQGRQIEPVKDHRRRRSSSIISHVEQETFEDENDQQVLPNMNASWVDQRGAWIIHIVIIILLKLFYNLLPGITNEWSWTDVYKRQVVKN